MSSLNKISFIVLIAFFCLIPSCALQLSNKHASKEAVAVYNYIQQVWGKKTLSGQMEVPWSKPNELVYTRSTTGKQPVIRGLDLENADPAKEVRKAINWVKAKRGIPSLGWHWITPGTDVKIFNNIATKIDINKCFQQGTKEYSAFRSELQKKASLLKLAKNANVPILFRPFHEFNGNYFWWAKGGPENFKRLWRTMYNFYVHDQKLNNLIWVLSFADNPDAKWYPGRQYVDIAGIDSYKPPRDPQIRTYNKIKSIVGNDMPIAFTECGSPPDPDRSFKLGAKWAYWMIWHDKALRGIDKNYLKKLYNHKLIVTVDELPKNFG